MFCRFQGMQVMNREQWLLVLADLQSIQTSSIRFELTQARVSFCGMCCWRKLGMVSRAWFLLDVSMEYWSGLVTRHNISVQIATIFTAILLANDLDLDIVKPLASLCSIHPQTTEISIVTARMHTLMCIPC